jgi:3-oxoacyl-[acyl-carrier-protein] synthase-3
VHGLSLSFALQESGRYRHVLFVAADTYSRFVDWTDRSTAVFFGDGAAAVVLGPSKANWLLATVQGSDGSGASAITIPAGGSRLPADQERLLARQAFFQMRGGDVRAFALGTVPQAIRHVVTKAGLRLSDLSLVITHQANARIIEGCADQLGIERERMFVNVDRYANTAAASAGIALTEAVQAGRVKAGDNVVVVGFGSGLGWAATCLRWGERESSPARASS